MHRCITVILLGLVVAACGSDDTTSTSTSTTRVQDSTTTLPATTTTTSTTGPTTTTVTEETTTTSPAIDVEFRAGEVIGPGTFQVDVGDTVDIWVVSDVDDEMHVHGYDLLYDVEAGVPFNLTFVADVPGIFEVEVHTGHTLLFELEVSG